MYDDLNDVSSILDLIRSHESRAVDNAILKISQETPSIKTAIVFPPIIYGKGEGPVKQRSVQIPALSKVAIERGHAVRGGRGLAAWTNIHVADLARLFVLLAEKAEKGDDSDKIWGENGIYLPGVGEMVRPLPHFTTNSITNTTITDMGRNLRQGRSSSKGTGTY